MQCSLLFLPHSVSRWWRERWELFMERTGSSFSDPPYFPLISSFSDTPHFSDTPSFSDASSFLDVPSFSDAPSFSETPSFWDTSFPSPKTGLSPRQAYTPYNVVTNNCEHFVNWCRHGWAVSFQVGI